VKEGRGQADPARPATRAASFHPVPPFPSVVLPIYTYGQPVLRLRAADVEADSPDLQRLIDDMIETMLGATGVGLAAPQVGHSVRVFTVDLAPFAQELAEANGGVVPDEAREPFALINPTVEPSPDAAPDGYEEGCLSIPDLRESVVRPDRVRLRYLDRHFMPHEVEATGMFARVAQHEIDHLDGVLFTDRLSPLRRRLLQRRLRAMSRGEVEADYPIAPPE
jgi:peptide deformylase